MLKCLLSALLCTAVLVLLVGLFHLAEFERSLYRLNVSEQIEYEIIRAGFRSLHRLHVSIIAVEL